MWSDLITIRKGEKMKLNDKKLVKIFILILIILPIVAGCGQKKESPVQLYKEAETLQKQAEEYYQKKDYSNALQKYHLAIEKAKESAKSDWNLPNFLIETCEKEIALIEKRAKDNGLVYQEGRFVAIEERERILKEKKEKEEQERRMKVEAEQRQREEEEKERQRKEEEVKRRVQEEEQKRQEAKVKELQKIKATISGGVWVIKGGGASDILRGLDIYLCQSELPKSEVKDILQELSDKFLKESESHERSAEKQTFLADSSRNWAKKYKAAYDLTQLLLQREDTAKISLEAIHGLIIIANESSYSEEFTFSNIKGDMILTKLIAKAIVTKATTDIDGKYQIENISGGEYVLYAISMSSFSIIDWMVPVEIKQEENIKIDLYNQNAARIVNKSD